MFADLHTHSFFSDGTDSPGEIIRRGRQNGVRAVALTDHDTVAGLTEFQLEAKRQGVEAVPGLEISTSVNKLRIHILGYYIDTNNPRLLSFLKELSAARTENTKAIFEKLVALKELDYDWERVLELNPGRTWLHSSNVFKAMMADGFYSGWDQFLPFYRRYFGRKSPAYLDIEGFTGEAAVEIILEAKGVPVLAHPKLVGDDAQIKKLVDRGLAGIEAYYPFHQPEDVGEYLAAAKKFGLLVTGGTDWHGAVTEWRVDLGDCGINETDFAALKRKKAEIA